MYFVSCLTQQPIRLSVYHISHPAVFTATETAEWMKVFMSQQPWCRKCKTTWNVQETSWGLAVELQSFQLADLLSFLLTNSLHLSPNSKKLYCHNEQDYTATNHIKGCLYMDTNIRYGYWNYFACTWIFYSVCVYFFPFIITISSSEV